ncbi:MULTISPECIES: HesA/MoeB/ThiF family protein [Thermomonospora]|uniref:UBA/THIF-type NAD/FAD binding protein n=1 Tax=Thermomonospora curvata (strain ATCC 19995 / DSM 43183 / JCM 3096 / KCTC 9072 / NBRC 15933 / NCIMB 10081 / Henssen B9) TaxID=471852 RepID=D1AEW3_THECD|nr:MULTISPECIES: HesA/MoeB/ThiF family protein [Thermomonospora]ACY97688.1 UBA/THIF-type NAD/FAD binding protein [Thermomonospora curvata DSM 43183]PKK14431.1 MAG: molybdopterin biosynthesis protein MoeB [Thermomonospora sp. CIF 1]
MDFADTRYNRQELMPQIGPEGQKKLAEAHVVSIGAGGVKSSLLYYLVAAGVGRIRIIDFDRVELSNLNRQILYTRADIGRNKALAAADRLRRLNDEIDIEAVDSRVDEGNIAELTGGFDVIVEGGDSLAARLLVNDHCLRSRTPMVHASAQYNYGYVLTLPPGRTACFQCAFPDLPRGHGGSVPVLGVATGIAGCLGAAEVIKIITGAGRPIVNGYLTCSAFQGAFQFVPAARRPGCAACGEAAQPD